MPTRRPRMRPPRVLVTLPGEQLHLPLDEVIDGLRDWARRQPQTFNPDAPQNLVGVLIAHVIDAEAKALTDWVVKGEIGRVLGIPAGSELDLTVLREAIKRRLA
jgi:hypothetical protein